MGDVLDFPPKQNKQEILDLATADLLCTVPLDAALVPTRKKEQVCWHGVAALWNREKLETAPYEVEIKLIAAFLYAVHAEDMASSFGPPVEPMPEPVMGLVEDMLLEVEDPRTMSQERMEKIQEKIMKDLGQRENNDNEPEIH